MVAWKDFEKLIEKIQKDMHPNAVVEHNQSRKDKSGVDRQLDVTITETKDSESLFTIVECKRYSRNVSIEKVEAFVTKCKDLDATQGIIVSNRKFTEGAVAKANYHNIVLLSHREANKIDWNSLFGPNEWKFLFHPERLELVNQVFAIKVDKDGTTGNTVEEIILSLDDILLDVNNNELGTFSQIGESMYNWWFHNHYIKIKPYEVGGFIVDYACNDYYCKKDNVLYNLHTIRSFIKMSFRQYTVDFKLESGNVLNDAVNNVETYNEVTSNFVNHKETLANQAGRLLSIEEVNEYFSNPNHLVIPLTDIDKHTFFRISIAKTPN